MKIAANFRKNSSEELRPASKSLRVLIYFSGRKAARLVASLVLSRSVNIIFIVILCDVFAFNVGFKAWSAAVQLALFLRCRTADGATETK